MNKFQKIVQRQQKQIRKDFKKLEKIYPGCFYNGKPIVAVAAFPEIEKKK